MLRLKVQTLRTLLWTGNLLVVLAIAGLLVKMYLVGKKGNPYLPPDRIVDAMRAEASIERRQQGGVQQWSLYEGTWKLNVTGREPPPPPEIAEAQPIKEEIRPIMDVVRVDMIATGLQPRASIRYLEDGHLGVSEGEADLVRPDLPNKREPARRAPSLIEPGTELRAPYNADPFFGKVKDITAQGVLFSWGGDDILLPPDEYQKGDVVPRMLPSLEDEVATDEELARRAAEVRETQKLGDHGWAIGTEELNRLQEHHEELLDEVGVGMSYSREAGRPLLKLNRIPEDSLAAERGFEEGDVLHAINGEPISSKYAAVQYVRQNSHRSEFVVEIERRGTRIQKRFVLRQ